MDVFDIFIANVVWAQGGKLRPVLIIERHTQTMTVFKITTQYSKSAGVRNNFFVITDWQAAGLNKQS